MKILIGAGLLILVLAVIYFVVKFVGYALEANREDRDEPDEDEGP